MEIGGTPAQAALRELYEETGARTNSPAFLGYILIRLLGEKPDNYKYPYPVSYMVFYWARINHLEDIASNDEIRTRELFSPEQVNEISWIKENRLFYEEALRRAFVTNLDMLSIHDAE